MSPTLPATVRSHRITTSDSVLPWQSHLLGGRANPLEKKKKKNQSQYRVAYSKIKEARSIILSMWNSCGLSLFGLILLR